MRAVRDEAPYDLEYRLRRHDGQYRWFKARGAPLRDASGCIVRWFGTCTDIHDQREATAIALDNARLFAEVQRSEEALRSSNVELRQANSDLEQFAYAAAHDLQEPLRMVTSYTQLLERSLTEKLDERTRTFMQYVIGGATRMSLLLQDLLAYSETARNPDPGERVSLDRPLQQVLRNLQPSIAETGAEITIAELPCVRGRESQFVQLFQNLISNALKYSRPGVTPRIEIGSELSGGRWLVRVRDNGLGIDPAYHRQVFGVFKRLHGSEIPGTGIGLAICQRVVERAGGEIWVESEAGQGATFIFALPALPEDISVPR
jgi:light-regulated signal transduction histidine kinase (bacteriophytochrome)